jgi:KaiC/GvpD/RAD55 family RecA-like ATPase
MEVNEMAINRVSSGVEGLDELIEGGFPEGTNVLVTGGPGTGKSIVGLQFIVNGAQNREPGIYLTIEEGRGRIIAQAKQFGWDLERLEKEKKIMLNNIEEYDIDSILDTLEKEVKRLNAKRIVVDSLSMMGLFARDLDQVTKVVKRKDLLHTSGRELTRTQIVGMLRKLSALGTTNLLISEGQEAPDKIAEFAADGVIELSANPAMKVRTLSIVKMRETKIELGNYEFNFTEKGVAVKK